MQEIDIQSFISGLPISVRLIIPELILTGLIFFLVIFDLFRNKQSRYFIVLCLSLGLVFAILVSLNQFGIIASGYLDGFSGMFRLDSASVFFRILFLGAGVLFLLFSLVDRKQYLHQASMEYYLVFLGVLLGSTLLVSSVNLLAIYISIELVSLSSYILTVFNFNKSSLESGLKYLLFGALSSGIMLYGLSFIYGFTGNLEITDPEFLTALQKIPLPALVASLLFVLSGLFFKMSAIPFHLWAPDIYQGAPTPIVAFFSVVPKLAGLVVFTRLYFILKGTQLAGFDWDLFAGAISIITLTIGNLVALWQTDAKRMMAYSSISHAGLMIMAAVVFNKQGFDALLFYAVVYLFMNFLVFYIIEFAGNQVGSYEMKAFRGLGHYFPITSLAAVVGFIALTGLPPTAGFTGKLLIFSAVWNRYDMAGSGIWGLLLIVGLINTVIALFYYLKIPYYLYFKARNNEMEDKEQNITALFALFLMLPLLLIFFKPDWLLELINTISFAF